MSSSRSYLEDRAELSDHEEEYENDERMRRRRMEEEDDEDSENDEGIPDEFEQDDFLVENDEEEEEEDTRGKRKRHDEGSGKNKRKRLKKVGETDKQRYAELQREIAELRDDAQTVSSDLGILEEDNYDDEDEDDYDRVHDHHQRERSYNTTRVPSARASDESLARQIFGDDDSDSDDELGGSHYYDDDDEFMDDERDRMDDDEDVTSKYERLRKMFGQEALEQRFMTEEDERIRESDEPERVLLRQGFRDVSDEELREEAEWIFYDARFDLRLSSTALLSNILGGAEDQDRERCIGAIHNVLVFIFKNKLDIPFISTYRKEYFEPTLKNDEDLWKIFARDEKWCLLKAKKAKLAALYDQTPNVGSFYRDQLKQATTNETVNDLTLHYQTMYGEEKSKEAPTPSNIRRPTRRDPYAVAKRHAGIMKMARSIVLSPEQYAENLFWESTRHHTDDPDFTPSQEAEQFVNQDFRSASSVLAAARHINALEISQDPYVRSKVRAAYDANATVSTSVTDKGKTAIIQGFDEISQIQKSPINIFGQLDEKVLIFMRMVKAEKDGLIKINISIDSEILNQCLRCDDLYCSIMTDERAQLWNEQRRLIFEESKKLLHEPMVQYLMNKYTMEFSEVIAVKCEETLERNIMAGPVGLQSGYMYPHRYKRVLACCPSLGDELTTFVLLDENMNVVSVMQWNFDENAILNAIREGQSNPNPKAIEQIKNFQTFLREGKPDTVAVAATGTKCHKLYNFLAEQISRFLTHGVRVHFVADDFARAYENSSRGAQEFPEYRRAIVKRAISIGRRLIDPLSEIAGFFNRENDIITICPKFHALQDMVPQDLLLQSLEKVMIRSVCKVGVDINRIIRCKHQQVLLHFVCGLGPRKAAHIINRINNLPKSRIELRQELAEVSEMNEDEDDAEPIIGPRVYMNCAGFIRIQNEYGEPLDAPFDRTRIHPESYELGQKVLVDALDVDDVEKYDIQDLLDEIHGKKFKLEDLDLDVYADQLEKLNMGKKHITLRDIARELAEPFRDPRTPFVDLSPEEVFYMAIGDLNRTLKENQVITVTINDVIRPRPKAWESDEPPIIKLRCMLDNGVVGIIDRDHMKGSDFGYENDNGNKQDYEEGAMLEVVVLDILYDQFEVNLDARSHVVSSRKTPEEIEEQAKSRRSRSSKPRRLMRKIDHPYFHNFNLPETINYLKDKEPGETVIRPSSKGDNYLAVTFKFFGDTNINLDIREEKKTDRFSIGKELYVHSKMYEDIDEIVFRCVRPMVNFAQQLVDHEKYVDVKSSKELEQILQDEKKDKPKGIPYRIALNKQHPGRFYISYLPRRRVKQVHITITSDGYGFMKRVFHRPSKLINAFKQYAQARIQKYKRQNDDEDVPMDTNGTDSERPTTSAAAEW